MAYRILVAEDDDKSLYLINFLLESQGFQVIKATDGATAVDIAINENPDLILMDMQLPVMDGYEATRRIKAEKKSAHIPVIAMTAYAMKGDRAKSIEAGCQDYITKPIDTKYVLDMIRKYLSPNQTNYHD